MTEQTVYLDTSALAKRYMKEKDSDRVDAFYRDAQTGSIKIGFSLWNIGEAAVVFDKYRKTEDPKKRLELLIDESVRLSVSSAVEIVEVTFDLVRRSAELVLKHHLYISDAIQLASALDIKANAFATTDGPLARAAKQEGFNVVELSG